MFSHLIKYNTGVVAAAAAAVAQCVEDWADMQWIVSS